MEQNQINVLFLGGAKRVSFAERLIATGKEDNIAVRIYSYELSKEVPIASVGTVIEGLRWSDSGLTEHLCSVIAENQISLLLPFVDPAIEVACRMKEHCPELFVPVSSPGICRIMFDKQLAQEWFEENEIPVPKAYSADAPGPYPLILKPRRGSASKGIEIVRNTEELACFGKRYALTDYLMQQYIPNRHEYTVDCYITRKGKPWSIVPRIRKETAGGEATVTETVSDTEIIRWSEALLKKAPFSGPVTLQFMRDLETGCLYMMEINPRYGGGVIASFAAGANSLKPLIAETLNQEPELARPWLTGVTMSRYFKEVIFYAADH